MKLVRPLQILLAAVVFVGLYPPHAASSSSSSFAVDDRLTALIAQATPEAEVDAPPAFSTLPRRCPQAGPVGEVEGETYACGVFVVPENYEEEAGRRIELTFMILRSTSLSPAPDPVVYLEGGPGASAVDRGASYAEVFADPRMTRDVILFDQRGTKYSGRLDCTAYLVAVNYLAENDPEFGALIEEARQQANDDAVSGVLAQVYMQACAEGLTDFGVDLSLYNSATSARDVVSLVDRLGYEAFNLYGVSYGTRLALTIMRDRPENLRSVVLDSVYPPQVDGYEVQTSMLEDAVEQVIADCEADRACRGAYPNLRTKLRAVLDVIPEDGPALDQLRAVLEAINRDRRVAPYIPRMIDELSEGSTATLEGVLSGEIFTVPPIDPAELTQVEVAVLTAEQADLQAEDLLSAAAEEARAQRPGASWFRNLDGALAQVNSEADKVDATIALFAIPSLTTSPDRQVLDGLVEGYVPANLREPLREELAALPDEEVRFVYDLIADVADQVTGSGLTEGMYYAVECREETPFNSEREAAAAYRTLDYPELAAPDQAAVGQAFAICAAFPTAAADDVETEAVESDVPTLVLTGAYDTQTPAAWGRLITEELTNDTYVEFPNTGHGAISFSQCARDVAEAFVNNPAVEPGTTCAGDLRTQFVTGD